MIGKLVRIPHGKFFAFVHNEGTDYFFHREDYNGNWSELEFDFNAGGEPIVLKFEMVEDWPKGPRAKRVERV